MFYGVVEYVSDERPTLIAGETADEVKGCASVVISTWIEAAPRSTDVSDAWLHHNPPDAVDLANLEACVAWVDAFNFGEGDATVPWLTIYGPDEVKRFPNIVENGTSATR